MKRQASLMWRGAILSILPLALLAPAFAQQIFTAQDKAAKELLGKMTLEEKIGQMIQADQDFVKDKADIGKYFLGSILSGGSSDPKEGNSVEAWANLYDACQKEALKTRLAIPILYGVDAVHGHNNVIGAVVFPHNIGLGCANDPELTKRIARVTAREVRATGVNWTFAPCVTVPRDERWGRTYEGFSEDPGIATVLGKAATLGFQGKDLSSPFSILACAKHYVGDGGTAPNSSGDGKGWDQGDTRVDEETLRRVHLRPYIDAIQAGVGSIMPSYSSWNGVKCSGSKYLMTDVLKKELGFDGFLISDYNAIDQLDPDYKTAIGKSINAGMDMAMVPTTYVKFFNCLKELVNEKTVPISRIDDAVTRILRVKIAMGLLDKTRSPLTDRKLMKSLGSPRRRAVAREAVRKSLVLLKNEKKTLPISKSVSRLHVAGKSADDTGNLCGGWTIDWQGKSGEITSGSTTILAGIRAAVSGNTKVTFSQDGSGAKGADIGLLVIGETPYAEMKGDRHELGLNDEDLAAFKKMKKAGIPIAVVLVSGRPMILGDILEQSDAFIAAWLPGTEGQGVADVLFGDYKPTGKLAVTWPRSVKQLPINVGDKPYDPLFKFGFGLTY